MIKVSSYLEKKFGFKKEIFLHEGVFDSFIDEDSPFFVDPVLVKNTKQPIFMESYERFLGHFRNVLKLLLVSKKKDDLAWRSASKLLIYQERPAFGLGYTDSGRGGNGIGDKYRERVLDTIYEIKQLGIEDPTLFELIGAFEDGIGLDRISDMTCSILYDDFLKFTEHILTLGNITFDSTFNSSTWGEIKTLSHPNDVGAFLVLVPVSFLRTLSLSEELGRIDKIVETNASLRSRLNSELGADWKKVVVEYRKKDFKEYLLSHPELIKELLQIYQKSRPLPYDFSKDYLGEYQWYYNAEKAVADYPLKISDKIDSKEKLIYFVKNLINHFRDLIENKGLWRNLYRDEGEYKDSHREKYAQNLFRACADLICHINDVDLSPEVDGGRGPVDFKLSQGSKCKILIEIKKSNNSKLIDGYEKQLVIYQDSLNTNYSFYVVIDVNETPYVTERLKSLILRPEGKNENIEVVYIDGLPKKSASNE